VGYGLDDRGTVVRLLAGIRDFSLLQKVQPRSGPHTAAYPMGAGRSFPGSKAAGRNAGYSPAASTVYKNALKYIPPPPYNCMKYTGTTLTSGGLNFLQVGRDSSVGIATRSGLDGPEIESL
jgi:hypothetical protein